MDRPRRFHDYLELLLDFIYPRNIYCILCEKPIDKTEKYSLCPHCRTKIDFILDKTCGGCGKPLDHFYGHGKCPDCIHMEHPFIRGVSCVVYDDAIKSMVHRLKYKGQRYLAYPMAQIMADRWTKEDISPIDVIVPVPMYKRKERIRGFNQSQLLGKYMARSLNCSMDSKNFIKTKDTLEQNKLLKDQRIHNLQGAFDVISTEKFFDKNILLVDDVYTTGSTMDACAKVLLRCSPRNVFVMTFATGKNIWEALDK